MSGPDKKKAYLSKTKYIQSSAMSFYFSFVIYVSHLRKINSTYFLGKELLSTEIPSTGA